MWKWRCPKHPGMTVGYHNEQEAQENLKAHKQDWPCELDHELWDDGVPCQLEERTGRKCTIPYIPEESNAQKD